jgi:PAS domain S-box-containing protein
MHSPSEPYIPVFLLGGGEMGERIRNFDWSKTPLGDPENWEQSLKICVRIMLSSSQPIWIGWGKDLSKLYNDPYISIVGGKHPRALGQPVSVVWKDIWTDIEPMLKTVMDKDEGTYMESQLLIMERNGYPEETYYTFSYSPIPGDNGVTNGVFCANTDDTSRVINERALDTLRNLGKISYKGKDVREVYTKTAEVLAENNKDFPFAFFYEINGNEAKAVAWEGERSGYDPFPQIIDINRPDNKTKNVCKAIATNQPVLVSNNKRFQDMPKGFWDIAPAQRLHIPLCFSNNKCPNAVLNIGLNPYRKYDTVYQTFIELLTDQIVLEMNNMHAMEEERKRAEALEEIDKAKTIFFNNISHEFRTPLTLMLGPLEELMRQPETEISAQHLARIETAHRNAIRLLKLVNTLLDFSRIESGRQQAQFTEVDIAGFTKSLASSFDSIIEKAGMQLIINTKPVQEPVYVDKQMWEKIVFNLLSNAFKYTLEGSISVNLFPEKDRVILEVVDTGIGIPETELAKIFERFHRVKGPGGRSYEGTGIGLSLIKELVSLHKGTIEVKSKEGRGSSFIVTIPSGKEHLPVAQLTSITQNMEETISKLYTEEAAVLLQPAARNETEPFSSNGKSYSNLPAVLVVDDNADMREYITALLIKNFHVITAGNGLEALEKIKQRQPDLILSDIMMPVMDGNELIKEIKQNRQTARIPVILLSARAGEEAKIEGYDVGADDYLVKPFSAKELLARVRAQIKMVQLRNEQEGNVRNLFMKAPAMICVFRGPQHVYELANERFMEIIGHRDILGKPIREALPELEGTGIYEILDDVYNTGKSFIRNELPVMLEREKGKLEEVIFNLVYQPSRNSEGKIDGIMVYALDVTKQVIAHRQIQQSEKKYRELVTALPVAVYTCDAEGKISFYNEIATKLWGYAPNIADESLKFCAFSKVWMTDGTYVPPEQTPMALALKTGQSFRNVEVMMQRLDGEKFYAAVNIDPLFDEEGNLKGAINIFQDITNIKQAEIALRDNEERYKNLINGLPIAFYTTDQNGALTLYNQAAVELWGRYPQIGKDMWCGSWKIFEADGNTEVPLDECPMAVCLKEKRKVITDNYFIVERPDGTRRFFQPFPEPIYNSQGEMIGATNTLIDLTEQVMARKKIEESEKRFRLLVESLPQLVWVTDEKGNREFVSQEWQEYTGFPPALIDKKWPSIVHPDDLENITKRWNDSLIAGNSYKCEVRLKGKAGEFRWHSVIGVPVFDHENRIIKWVGAFTDIDILKREQQRKDSFMSMASHELKTPITTIKAYGEIAEMMLEKKGDEATLAIQKKMGKQVNKLTTLVTDLLDNIRIRNGKLMYAEAFYNFNELVHEVIDDLQKINPAYKINLNEGKDVTVFGDKEKIGQVINNLITNAQKYSPGAFEIIVTIEVQAEGVQLSVKDFGIGISPSDQQHIFEQFYRVNGESQSTFPGMGIGLYICAEIISRQGGKIWVESAIGEGSTFYIRLPLDNRTGNQA